MKPDRFMHLVRELVEENPFAIRPFLKLARVRFTDTVPTMAVTREAGPELLVNMGFVRAHCHGDAQVKAVILHEFLHILLRHTEGRGPLGDAEHLAMDAVINAIIHRQVGPEASAMMTGYYREAKGAECLLRPPNPGEIKYPGGLATRLHSAWAGLYQGRLVVDDIRELAECLAPRGRLLHIDLDRLLGNHRDLGKPLPEGLQEALVKALRTMDGGGIWRSPRDWGLGVPAYAALVAGSPDRVRAWERAALAVLRAHLLPDRMARETREVTQTSLLPVLSPSDRRSFLQALWNPILPTSRWECLQPKPLGTAQVYLDVSGSMNAEMPLIIGLLNRLRRTIRMPFWAFSTVVAPARIEGGLLKTDTTGGTSLGCVLDHIARTRPESAVIVTDGYIETIPRAQVLPTQATRIHTLLTRDGSPTELDRAGLSYTQLAKVPS
jgi:hypothetical protein